MHDLFQHGSGTVPRTLADYHVKQMVLSPEHWRRCSLPMQLNWKIVRFSQTDLNNVPDDVQGVYTFVLKPGVADHPACAYLLYVGKTERQGFRQRYKQYLRDLKAGSESRRPHVTEMLEKWHEFLWFCYAPVGKHDIIDAIEKALLSAYLPPTNKDFPAEISRSLRKLFGT